MTPQLNAIVIIGTIATGIAAGGLILRCVPIWDRFAIRRIGLQSHEWGQLGLNPAYLMLGLRAWGFGLVVLLLTFWVWLEMPIVSIVCSGIAYTVLPHVVDYIIAKRRTLLRDQMVAATHCLASHTEAGSALASGFEAISTDTPEPLAAQFRRIVSDYKHGSRLTDAIQSAREKLRLESFSLFAAAIQVTISRGGRVNEALARISHSLQEQQRIERKVASDTANGRRVVQILAVFPVGFLIMLQGMAPDEVQLLYTTFAGNMILATAMVVEYVGIRMALNVIRLR